MATANCLQTDSYLRFPRLTLAAFFFGLASSAAALSSLRLRFADDTLLLAFAPSRRILAAASMRLAAFLTVSAALATARTALVALFTFFAA